MDELDFFTRDKEMVKILVKYAMIECAMIFVHDTQKICHYQIYLEFVMSFNGIFAVSVLGLGAGYVGYCAIRKYKDETPSEYKKLPVRHVYLISTGQTDQSDHLTPLGQQQSKRVSVAFRSFHVDIDQLVINQSAAVQETADLIADSLPSGARKAGVIDPCLDEQRDNDAAFDKYFAPATRETKHEAPNRTVLVCPEAVLRYLICRSFDLSPYECDSMRIPHASITHLRIHPSGKISASALASTDHLSKAMITS